MADLRFAMLQVIEHLSEKRIKQAKQLLRKHLPGTRPPDVNVGAAVNVCDRAGETALIWACKVNTCDVARVLLTHGADPNVCSGDDGCTPLLWAARNNSPVLCGLLIGHGSDVNTTDDRMNTALYWAVRHNNAKLVKDLLQAGARDEVGSRQSNADDFTCHMDTDDSYIDLDGFDEESIAQPSRAWKPKSHLGRDPRCPRHVWEVVIRNGRTQLAKLLLDHGYGANDEFMATFSRYRQQAPRQGVWTPFLLAIRRNATAMSVILARAGGNLSAPNPDGFVPLLSAVMHRNVDLVQSLLELGADPNAGINPDRRFREDVMSPLHKACEKGYIPLIELMMQYLPDVKNKIYVQTAILFVLRNLEGKESENARVLLTLLHYQHLEVNNVYSEYSDLYRHSSYAPRRETLQPEQFIVMIKSGLQLDRLRDNHDIASVIRECITGDKLWFVKAMFTVDPMYFRITDVQNEMDEVCENMEGDNESSQSSRIASKKKRELKNIVAQMKQHCPSLLSLAVYKVRCTLSECSPGESLFTKIDRLGYPQMLTGLLRMDTVFPASYRKDYGAWKKPIVRMEQQQRERMESVDIDSDSDSDDNLTVPSTHLVPIYRLDDEKMKEWGLHINKSLAARANVNAISIPVPHLGQQLFHAYNVKYVHMMYEIQNICVSPSLQRSKIQSLYDFNSNITRHLMSLDEHIHIGGHNHGINYNNIKERITTFLQGLVSYIKEHHHLDFTLLPCGSVHVGNKVNKFDELDFILAWNTSTLEIEQQGNTNDPLYKVTHEVIHKDLRHSTIKEVLFRCVLDFVNRVNGYLRPHDVRVEAVLPHRRSPGVYMCLSWSCHRHHTHEVSIDLTPVIIAPNQTLGDVWSRVDLTKERPNNFSKIIDKLKSAPVCLIPLKGIVTLEDSDPGFVTTEWKLTMNICDWKLFAMLDDVSFNIRKVYRLMKIIRDRVCPREFKSVKLHTIFPQELFHREKQIVSSHMLENIVLNEVEKNCFASEWSDANFTERLLGCLQSLKDNLNKPLLTGKNAEIIPTDIQQPRLDLNMKLIALNQSAINHVMRLIDHSEVINHIDNVRSRHSDMVLTPMFRRGKWILRWSQESLIDSDVFTQMIDFPELFPYNNVYTYKIYKSPENFPVFLQLLNRFVWGMYIARAGRS